MKYSETDINRFLEAQESPFCGYEIALKEIQNGKKTSHWIWYIFPQQKGLGHSYNSEYYGLDGIDEARAYLAHPVLGARLREITTVVLESDKDVEDIFGGIDTIKLRSCMTLFAEIADDDLFDQVLEKCFEGKKDEKTLELLEKALPCDERVL